MQENPAYLVYGMFPAFLKNRGLTALPESKLDTPRNTFITELNHFGHFTLNAAGEDRRVVSILLLAPNSRCTEQSPHLRSLISSLDTTPFARERRFAEVIIVAPPETMKKKNIIDVVLAFQEAASENPQRTESLAEFYNIYPYSVFSLDLPRVQGVSRCVIADPAAVQAFLARDHRVRTDLKQIVVTDPVVIWAGARPGQVVQIISPSETAGEAHTFYFVTRA